MTKVLLLRSHTEDDRTYPSGVIVDFDLEIVEQLVASGEGSTRMVAEAVGRGVNEFHHPRRVTAGPDSSLRIYNPRGLRRFRAALDGGTSSLAHIVCFGDSITEGVGVDDPTTIPNYTNSDDLGWPGQLSTLFARQFGLPRAGCLTANTHASPDARVTRSAGVTDLATTGPMQTGVQFTNVSNAGGPGVITFSAPSCTGFDILVYQSTSGAPTTGAFKYSVDGGAAVSVANTNLGYRAVSVTGLSQNAHTIAISGDSNAPTYLFGIRYHSGAGVTVSRFAKAGGILLDAFGLGAPFPGNNTGVGNPPAQARLAASFGAWSPDLTIIAFAYNDWLAQMTAQTSGLKSDPATYRTYLQMAVDSAIAAGGSVLLLGEPRGPAASTPAGGASFDAYLDVLKTIARNTDHCSALLTTELWKSPADAVALGLHSATTSVHPSRRGHGSIARMTYEALTGAGLNGL
jgi:hypothetical protein